MMVRKKVAASGVVLALVSAAVVTGHIRQGEDDVRSLNELQKRVDAAIVSGDAETHATLIAADAVLMPPGGPSVVGRDAIREWSRNNARSVVFQAYEPADAELIVSGDWAFRRASFSATMAPASGGPAVRDTGKFIIIYERQRDGSWKVARDIWNSDGAAAR